MKHGVRPLTPEELTALESFRGKPGDVWCLLDGWAAVGEDGKILAERYASRLHAEVAASEPNPSKRAYKLYLLSPEWKARRLARLKLDGFRCVGCGHALGLEVHHLTYERLGDEDIERDLVTLCRNCHAGVHEAA